MAISCDSDTSASSFFPVTGLRAQAYTPAAAATPSAHHRLVRIAMRIRTPGADLRAAAARTQVWNLSIYPYPPSSDVGVRLMWVAKTDGMVSGRPFSTGRPPG